MIAAIFFTANAQQHAKVTSSGIGYLEYLPDGYHGSSADFPVVISLHGIKEKGTSSTNPDQVLRDLPRVANVGLPKYVKAGKKYPFILISPQLKSQYATWPASFVMDVVNHVKKTLRIDEKRIYLTGLSLGGFGVWTTAGAYPDVFAAIAPICAGGNSMSKANGIAKEDVATWGFHGDADRIVSYTVTTRMVNAINSAPRKPSPLAKVTIFPGMGHVIWDKAYNETNVLDWMLNFRNGSARGGNEQADGDKPKPDKNEKPDKTEESDKSKEEEKTEQQDNKPPVANAGADRSITLPANAITIEGKASDPDGKVATYAWTKISGGSGTLSQTSSATLQANNLSEGVYVFRFTVKDDNGAATSDDVTVTVNAAEKTQPAENVLPVANAGPDRALTLPDNATYLQGGGHDADGSIASYHWMQISGQPVTLNGSSARSATVSNLKQGSYVFRLTIKDDRGGTSSDDVKITVSGQATANNAENSKTPDKESQDILPQTYPGTDRNNGGNIDYEPISDDPWISGN